MRPSDLPPPFSMCSKDECDERQRLGEVSVFECTDETLHAPTIRQRVMDPIRAVSKYRRSAAGSTIEDGYPLRSVQQLTTTVDYLLSQILAEQHRIVVHNQPPHSFNSSLITASSKSQQKQQQQKRESLLSAVRFVEDRLRAVQVELVKLGHPKQSRMLQVRMARCHILILYFVGDSPSYENTFGYAALQTALSSYFTTTDIVRSGWSPAPPQRRLHDEILSYSILFALRIDLLAMAQNPHARVIHTLSLTSSVLGNYRTAWSAHSSISILLRWSLSLVAHVLHGNWNSTLRHLLKSDSSSCSTEDVNAIPVGEDDLDGNDEDVDDTFVTRVRCLLAPCLNFFRLQALKAYDASFAKEEAISAVIVARLLLVGPPLCSSSRNLASRVNDYDHDEDLSLLCADDGQNRSASSRSALRLAQAAGLPVNEQDAVVVFKASSTASASETLHNVQIPNQHVRSDENGWVFRRVPFNEVHLDEDGIQIPSPAWIRRHL